MLAQMLKSRANPEAMKTAVTAMAKLTGILFSLITVVKPVLSDVGAIQEFMHKTTLYRSQSVQPSPGMMRITPFQVLKARPMFNRLCNNPLPRNLGTEVNFTKTGLEQRKVANGVHQPSCGRHMPTKELQTFKQSIG